VAEVAAAAGHEVTLITGPTALCRPSGCRCVEVRSAAEMAAAVKREFPVCQVLVMAAAVADYRPCVVAAQKLKKTAARLTLGLERTEDILASVARLKRPGQVVVGFAAETQELLAHARAKLRRKSLDFIVANDVSRSDIGFGADRNEVTVISADAETALPLMTKVELAGHLLRIVTGKG
jgi:phosphopantothenoylcysteine decarboxylase/phosphopantothenate--cysteine ligase